MQGQQVFFVVRQEFFKGKFFFEVLAPLSVYLPSTPPGGYAVSMFTMNIVKYIMTQVYN